MWGTRRPPRSSWCARRGEPDCDEPEPYRLAVGFPNIHAPVSISLQAHTDSVVLEIADDERRARHQATALSRRNRAARGAAAVTTLVRDYLERGGRGEERFDVLTPRELEVLQLIAEARTSTEIAAELVMSVKTVERHRQKNILDKLGMRHRVELTRYAVRRGLIQP
jgi:DNA-binding NarL/FixJ family response regulator